MQIKSLLAMATGAVISVGVTVMAVLIPGATHTESIYAALYVGSMAAFCVFCSMAFVCPKSADPYVGTGMLTAMVAGGVSAWVLDGHTAATNLAILYMLLSAGAGLLAGYGILTEFLNRPAKEEG
jgi:hypothetical protein